MMILTRRASFTGGGGAFGAGNYLNDVYVTWDENYLYVALTGAEKVTTSWPCCWMWIRATAPVRDHHHQLDRQRGLLHFLQRCGLGGPDQRVRSGFYGGQRKASSTTWCRCCTTEWPSPDTNTIVALFDHGERRLPGGQSGGHGGVWRCHRLCALNGYEARIPWSVLYGSNTGRYGTVNSGEVDASGRGHPVVRQPAQQQPGQRLQFQRCHSRSRAWVRGWTVLLTSDTYLEISGGPGYRRLPRPGAGRCQRAVGSLQLRPRWCDQCVCAAQRARHAGLRHNAQQLGRGWRDPGRASSCWRPTRWC
jgi:hypothetical protein